MRSFKVKTQRRQRKTRGSAPSRFAYRTPESKNQQQIIHNILWANGAQAKLNIGQSSDKTEQEADQVADQIMAMSDTPVEQHASTESGDVKSSSDETYAIQDSGEVLPVSERAFFEPRFGRNFSQVRVHQTDNAATLARSLNARAFTLGRDIVFDQGEYSPDTATGRQLLAHELTHIVQQSPENHRKTSVQSTATPEIQSSASKGVVQRNGHGKIKPFKGAGWVNEENARIKKNQRKNFENYTKAGSPATRKRLRTKLSSWHLKFVKWCESSTGKDAKAFLQYLKNSKYPLSCWPNEKYPYEVTINGPGLKLVNSPWPWWPSKVEKVAIAKEPRITNPHMYAYHVSMDKIHNLQPEMKDLIDRYSGYTSSNVPVNDKRLLKKGMNFTKPSHVKWKSLSDEMRICWRAALSQGKTASGDKGISAFQNQANALHNDILAGIKYVYAKFGDVKTSHEFKKLVGRLKGMGSDTNAAMFSYRKDLEIGVLDKWRFKIKKRWNRNPLK